MVGSKQRKAALLFGLSDVCVTAISFALAYRARLLLPLENDFFLTLQSQVLLLGFCAGACVTVGYWLNIYGNVDSPRIRVILRDATKQVGYAALGVLVLEYVLHLDLSRPFLGMFAATNWGLLIGLRIAARHLIPAVRREFGAPRYVLVVGTGPRARRWAQTLEEYSEQGLQIMGFASTPSDDAAHRNLQFANTYPVFATAEIPALLKKHVIDEVHFAVEAREIAELEEVFLWCDLEGVCTRINVDFFPHVTLESLGSTPLLTFATAPDDEVLLLVKRLTDIALASLALIVLSPLMVLTALLIRLTSPGPAIFRQTRCGLNGRRFTFYKFRSMVVDAEDRLHEVAHLNPKRIVIKIPNDPRLTPLGKWLRKFSIDELPQLINVIKGDMALVGPRPAIPSEVEKYKRWQRRRLRMRPGLTCLWALNGRDKVDFESWMKLDIQYIDTWSLALDLRIIVKTIPQVLLGRGAS